MMVNTRTCTGISKMFFVQIMMVNTCTCTGISMISCKMFFLCFQEEVKVYDDIELKDDR